MSDPLRPPNTYEEQQLIEDARQERLTVAMESIAESLRQISISLRPRNA